MVRVLQIGQLAQQCRVELEQAGVCFGHGTDNAADEAAWLVLHVTGKPLDGGFDRWEEPVTNSQAARIRALLDRRINERRPLAYLLGEAWFCGLRFKVDESVLIPRSPLAELISRGFEPWVRPESVRRVLDLCTGSGCIAISIATMMPEVQVDAADISLAALDIAATNVSDHGLADRVRLVRSDLFDALGQRRYDLIVSNPPYVSDREMEDLPEEYRWEPRLALRAASDGLSLVGRILREAPEHLREQGLLFCEVGEAAERLQRRFPSLPLTWLEFAHGGGGVFTIDRQSLIRAAPAFGKPREEC